MRHRLSRPASGNSRLVAPLAILLAAAIFVVDTIDPFSGAVAVLYVVVVLLAGTAFRRRGILLCSIACIALTFSSFWLVHGEEASGGALSRCLMSIAAIAITTLLVLRNQSTSTDLSEKAQLLDLTHDAIFVRSMGGIITYWNRGAEATYGWSAEHAMGKSTHQLLQTVFPARLNEINRQLLSSDRWEGELVHTKRDGAVVVVSSRWSLKKDADGKPLAVLETNTDISQRRRAETEVLKARAELAHVTRLTTLGELMASIAHEVNQPLAGIVMNGEACLRWIDRDEPDLDEVRSAVKRSIADAQRASDIVHRIRALSKKGDIQMALVDVNELVNEALVLVRHELDANRITLKLDLASRPLPAFGDRIQLQQVLINLLINGIQAMASSNSDFREILVTTSIDESSQANVRIQDSGPGIDPDSARQLFNAFFTTKTDGIGMGLSICRSIVESHGGDVWIVPNPGGGAIFQFSLPRVEKDAGS
ncbi:PAS domain-containing sensor histidine kinase [Mesorhizobium sanjuanii]|uniref:histidine kinase n=1 Tax=Mesorhizobium sanjuanii TaxID=2037900 RepID=A0A2A6FBK2_9HYPH|nr:ATP-binding protein [Mesorhizobium sanjuanii]PDQ19360.1 PAS domain-containing sensor histidine kinase [Mesorhizobium sanjuanii]